MSRIDQVLNKAYQLFQSDGYTDLICYIEKVGNKWVANITLWNSNSKAKGKQVIKEYETEQKAIEGLQEIEKQYKILKCSVILDDIYEED